MADIERDDYEDEFEAEADRAAAAEGKGELDDAATAGDANYGDDDFDAEVDTRDDYGGAEEGDAAAKEGGGGDGDEFYDDPPGGEAAGAAADAAYEEDYGDSARTSGQGDIPTDQSYDRSPLRASGYDAAARGSASVGRSSGTRSIEHALGAGALTAESRRILARQSQKREAIKLRLAREKQANSRRKQHSRILQVDRWRRKTSKSPFAVDLLAEHERMDEEMRVREQEQSRRERLLARKREQVKAEIIVKALAEESDLEALRAEKRAILQEEQRLKAMLELEKAKLHRKADMQAAVRAERQRSRAKKEYRRDKYSALQRQRQETVRQQNMLAQGLITDAKTGHAVRVESEEGWFALQELVRAGALPAHYRPYLEAGAGAAPGLEVLEARAVADAARRRAEGGARAGSSGGPREGGGEGSSLSLVQGGGGSMLTMGDSMMEGSAGGGMLLAGTVPRGGGVEAAGDGDAIDAIMGRGQVAATGGGEDGQDQDDYEDDGGYDDDDDDEDEDEGAVGRAEHHGVGEQPSREDASAALSRLQGAD